MDNRDRNNQEDGQAVQRPPVDKRGYQSPALTEYGSVDELVDAGVVGSAPSIMGIGG
jgi:hypothetical protein